MEALHDELIRHYAWFHQHPELSNQEFNTTARIAQILRGHGIEILDSGLNTGLVAIVRGSAPSPVVALRGDIDALPVQESTGLPYASQTPGVMHACGHDFNLSVALGAAILLQRRRDQLAGAVKIIFQPAEEILASAEHPTGAVQVLNTGILDDVHAFFGTHDAQGQVGSVYISEGGLSGAVDKFQVTIHGVGTHAAHPNDGVDPIPALTSIVQGLQTVVGRNLDPLHPRLLSVTHIESGHTWNVLPQDAFFEGTVRTTEPDDRQIVKSAAIRIIENTASAYGTTASVRWGFGSPAVYNNPTWVNVARAVAHDEGIDVQPDPVRLGGEDFSYYLQRRQGLFVHVGAGQTGAIHGPTFSPDPAGIPNGARFLAALAIRALHSWQHTPSPTE